MGFGWKRRGGTALLLGIYSEKLEMDFNSIVGSEITVIGSVAASPGDMERAVELMARGKIDVKPLISETVPLSGAIQDGFNRMLDPDKEVFRIVIQPGA